MQRELKWSNESDIVTGLQDICFVRTAGTRILIGRAREVIDIISKDRRLQEQLYWIADYFSQGTLELSNSLMTSVCDVLVTCLRFRFEYP